MPKANVFGVIVIKFPAVGFGPVPLPVAVAENVPVIFATSKTPPAANVTFEPDVGVIVSAPVDAFAIADQTTWRMPPPEKSRHFVQTLPNVSEIPGVIEVPAYVTLTINKSPAVLTDVGMANELALLF